MAVSISSLQLVLIGRLAGFLTWHRKYLLEYENALRGLDEDFKCVTIPYWDWAEYNEHYAKDETWLQSSSVLQDFGGMPLALPPVAGISVCQGGSHAMDLSICCTVCEECLQVRGQRKVAQQH